MGTFGCYNGNMRIAEEKKDEFTKNIMKLLNYGGMMQFDKVHIYGKEIILIKPVELNQEGTANFHFNYFEDDVWESAGYKTANTNFFSGKIGWKEFNDVVTAVHMLYELYDDNAGLAEINGEIVEGSAYVGWINNILGTGFSMKKRFRLWDYFEKHCLEQLENQYGDVYDQYDLRDIMPRSLYWAMGGTELADICYLTKGTETLQQEELVPGSYPEAVRQCKKALEEYFADGISYADEESEQVNKIWELVKMQRAVRKNIREGTIDMVAECSLKLPARVLVYLTCEIKKLDFWNTWKEIHENVYHDEEMPQYASDELLAKRKAALERPVKPMATSDFLCDNSAFAFHGTPDELKGKPNYYLSDDDRAFWWDGSAEVVLSEKMEQWLANLAQRHKQIMKEMVLVNWDKEELLKKLVSILEETDAFYKRIFCFQNMFYEFLQNGADKCYIAAVMLLEKLAEEHKNEGKVIEYVSSWDITSKNVTHNAGRIAIKRYLSVMANRQLREKYFGF